MSAGSYSDALKRVLVYEGGYSNHPADPGGATMKGVTQAVYDGYRNRRNQPRRSVRDISAVELQDIYRLQYWDKVRGDDLPAGVDFVVFDGAVNSGAMQSAKWLQRALGVTVDGLIGEATLRAAREHPDHDVLIADMLARRLSMLQHLRTWKTFGKGWSARLASVKVAGQALATGSVGPAPVYQPGMDAKARAEDAAFPSAPIGGATAGAGGGSVAVTLETARQQIEPYAGSSSIINGLLAGLAVAGAGVAIGGVVYGLYAARRSKIVTAAIAGETKADLSTLPRVTSPGPVAGDRAAEVPA